MGPIARRRQISFVATCVLIAAVVVILWPSTGGAIANSVAAKSRRQLIDVLGVLRSRQTNADRNSALIDRLRSLAPTLQDPGPERMDRSLVRIAGVTPWGSRIVLAAFTTVGYGRPSNVPEMLGALVNGEIGARAPASVIRSAGEVAYFEIWGQAGIRVVVVVPDLVNRIAYRVPGMATINAAVRNNTTAFLIRPLPKAPGLVDEESSMIWYGPHGSIVKLVPSALPAKYTDSRSRRRTS